MQLKLWRYQICFELETLGSLRPFTYIRMSKTLNYSFDPDNDLHSFSLFGLNLCHLNHIRFILRNRAFPSSISGCFDSIWSLCSKLDSICSKNLIYSWWQYSFDQFVSSSFPSTGSSVTFRTFLASLKIPLHHCIIDNM